LYCIKTKGGFFMDKNSFSQYGTLVAVIIIIAIMLSFATPFGNHIIDQVKGLVTGFDAAADGALGEMGGSGTGSGESGAGGSNSGTETAPKLGAPGNITLVGSTLSFDAVANAEKYYLSVSDETNEYTATVHEQTSIDVSTYLEACRGAIVFKVVASDDDGVYANSDSATYETVVDWSIVGTWVFNDTITNVGFSSPGVGFVCANTDIAEMIETTAVTGENAGSTLLEYELDDGAVAWAYNFSTNTWQGNAYKTVTFAEDTDNLEFAIWLHRNATRQ
jgi:hypothetical protein